MTNPLLRPWDSAHGLPDFAAIQDDHFRPAFDAAIAEQETEFEAICENPEPATFENTVEALEKHGLLLDRVNAVFWNRAGGDTNPTIQEIEREISPRLSRLYSKHATDERIFKRLQAVVDQGTFHLTAEQARVLDLMYKNFVRGGAKLDVAGKARLQEIMSRLSELGTAFGQNVLKDEAEWSMILSEDDLDGLPKFLIDAAGAEAKRRGEDGYVITLSRSSIEPFMMFSARRDLRETAFKAWADRGESTNWDIIAETVKLRQERATLLGFKTFADFKLENQMAKNPGRVRELLTTVWQPARARALEEIAELAELAQAEGLSEPVSGWDYRYYAEKLRKAHHDLDEGQIKPFLTLTGGGLVLAAGGAWPVGHVLTAGVVHVATSSPRKLNTRHTVYFHAPRSLPARD